MKASGQMTAGMMNAQGGMMQAATGGLQWGVGTNVNQANQMETGFGAFGSSKGYPMNPLLIPLKIDYYEEYNG